MGNPDRPAHTVVTHSFLFFCAVIACPASVFGQIGPFIDAQTWQGGVGLDGDELLINTDGDADLERYPIIPQTLADHSTDANYLLNPDGTILYVRAWGDALSWNCIGTDNQIFFFRLIQDTDTTGYLEAIFNGQLCINGPFPDHEGLYEVPGQSHHIAYLVEVKDTPASTRQDIHWFNLNVDGEHSVTDLNVDVDGLYFDFTPDGTAVLIKHGLEHPATTADYTLVDLCPLPRLGNWMTSDVSGELFDLGVPDPAAEVIEYPVGSGDLWAHITHPDLGSDGEADVLLEPCTGAATGACCNGAVCTETTQAACSGSYQGDGTTCPHAACVDPVGACCVGGNCQVTTAAACSGSYQGDGTTCPHWACMPEADMSITKTVDVDPVIAGAQLTYTIEVTNNGPDDATDVYVYEILPSDVTGDPNLSSASCTFQAQGRVTCSLGTVPANTSASITIVVVVDPSARGVLTNFAEVDCNEVDPNPANDEVTEDTAVTTLANVSINLAAIPIPVPAGGILTFQANIGNAGPSFASGIIINHTLPPGVRLLNAQGLPAGASGPACGAHNLAPGDTNTSTIMVLVDETLPPGTVLTHTATVSSDEPDQDPSDNTDTVDVTVTSPSGPPSDRYRVIADENTPMLGGAGNFTGFDEPALSGDFVAFAAYGANFQDGVFRWSDGVLSLIADRNTLIPEESGTFWLLGDLGHSFSISGAQVAFHGAAGPSDYGIYLTDACGISVGVNDRMPSPSDPAKRFDCLWGPHISDGAFAFFGCTSSGINGIYIQDGSTTHIVADSSTPIPEGTSNFFGLSDPAFDGTDVAFWGRADNGDDTYTDGIYARANGTLIKVADENTPVPGGTGTFANFRDYSIAIDDGLIAFLAWDETPSHGIYMYDIAADTLSVVADLNTQVPGTTEKFWSLIIGQFISVSDGRVVFYGQGTSGDGLFIYDGRVLRPAVRNTDLIAGNPAAGFRIGTQGLDGNKIAFTAQLITGLWQFELAMVVGRLPVPGDFTGDEVVDLDDHAALIDCQAPPGTAPVPTPPATADQCIDAFDLDYDGDVDLNDVAEFQIEFGGG